MGLSRDGRGRAASRTTRWRGRRSGTSAPRRSEAANAAIVNYHHRLPMTQLFGTGTLSSSDGQKFPVKGKSLTAGAPVPLLRPRPGRLRLHPRLGPARDVRHEGHLRRRRPESPYVLDGILGNQTDLLIT